MVSMLFLFFGERQDWHFVKLTILKILYRNSEGIIIDIDRIEFKFSWNGQINTIVVGDFDFAITSLYIQYAHFTIQISLGYGHDISGQVPIPSWYYSNYFGYGAIGIGHDGYR